LLLAIAADVRVLLIKLADRLHNMRTLQYVLPEARRRAAEETLEIYAPLAGRMGMHEMREELDDLAFRELYPEACEVVTARLNALTERSRLLISDIEKQLTKKLVDRGIDARVVGRRKRAYSIWRKMERKSVGFEQLSDIFGSGDVKSLTDCYQARHCPRTLADGAGAFKDYISTPRKRLPLDPHHGDWAKQAACRIADPHRRHARDRRIRHRRHALYRDNAGSSELLSRESTAYAWLRRTIELLAEGSNPEEFLEHTKLELFHDQVFCFTPKGKLIALPRKATPIDFAYAVHTDVGNTAVGCKINGQIAPLTSELVNGDEVEIVTSKSQHAPPAAWNPLMTGRGARGPRDAPSGAFVYRSRPAHRRTLFQRAKIASDEG
jgi:(p)ppGpp synthase/HD superfamily hydrolase